MDPVKNTNDINKNDSDVSEGMEIGCENYWAWFIQIAVWAALFGSIAATIFGIPEVFIAFIIIYLLYLVTMLSNTTFHYLCNQYQNTSIYSKMGEYFVSIPKITFECICYHYETRYRYYTDSKGRNHRSTQRVQIVTHHDSFELPYYSVKDVSGLFMLNVDHANISKKCFIKLYLEKEINFADAISYSDYINQKNAFYDKNKNIDKYMEFQEYRRLPDFSEYNLVQISDYRPPILNVYMYVLSTILMVCQYYKTYIDRFCVYQKFKIRKLISTRYNLLEPEYAQNYSQMVPALNLVDKTLYYEPSNTGYCSSDYNIDLPTKEEIEQAEQYQDKIPKYGITSVGGEIGIVQDLPSSFNQNYNIPPQVSISTNGDMNLENK